MLDTSFNGTKKFFVILDTLVNGLKWFFLITNTSVYGVTGWDDVDWTALAQIRNKWRALANMVMNFQVS
jgi:hypothetical protein